MANDLNRSIKIYIDGSDAQQGIAKVEAAVQKLEQQLRSLNQSEEDYEAKSEKLKAELTAKNRTLENYRKKVEETDRVLKNLSGATYNELLSVQKQLRKELNAAVPGTEKYTRAMEQYQRVARQTAAAQQAMRVEVGAQGSFMNRAADSFNRYAGLVASGLATMTGLTLSMRQCVDEYAKMEEAESQVIKYTNMTREEVRQLNGDFKNMDTRTPRDELNRLAGEAGKLGITGVDGVRDFVEAADMINVALGEDLGEEAVNSIGKLSQMFGDEHREERTKLNEYMDKIQRHFPYVEKLLPLIDFCRNTLKFSERVIQEKTLQNQIKTLEDRALPKKKSSIFVIGLRRLFPRHTRKRRSVMLILYLKT